MNQTTPKRNGWTRFGVDLPFKMLKHKKIGSITSRERERERERELELVSESVCQYIMVIV